MVGLVVTATLSLTGILNMLMRQLSDVEVQMNRCAFVCTHLRHFRSLMVQLQQCTLAHSDMYPGLGS